MKDFWEEQKVKKLNKKRIVIISLIILLIIFIITIAIIYSKNETFREWIDKNILRKEVNQENLVSIEIKENENPTVYAFNQYIGILNKNEFKIYNNTGKEEATLNLSITTPIISSNNRYIAIGEDNGQKLYLIVDKDIVWETEIEGNISNIVVNQNGYVAVSITNTINKTVVSVYDPQGNELFKTFYASNRVGDIAISNDNKYLAVAEIDTSGTIIKSNIQTISIEGASSNPESSAIKKYEGENNSLISNIEYQENNKLVCLYTNKIDVISEDGNVETLTDISDKKNTFSSVELSNNIVKVTEESSGLFTADSIVTMQNTESKKETTYKVESVTKEIYTSKNKIGLNLGTEIEFINTSGWLVKRYISNQEITKVTMTDSIAGIVFRDRIEIVNL